MWSLLQKKQLHISKSIRISLCLKIWIWFNWSYWFISCQCSIRLVIATERLPVSSSLRGSNISNSLPPTWVIFFSTNPDKQWAVAALAWVIFCLLCCSRLADRRLKLHWSSCIFGVFFRNSLGLWRPISDLKLCSDVRSQIWIFGTAGAVRAYVILMWSLKSKS